MKLSVMQENLARGLQVVSRAVSTRNTLPVLANVLLKTEDAGLKLTATNLEIGITYWVPGKIETDGATTVPARLLTDLVSSLPSAERVDLELQGADTLHIRAGRFATHVKGIDADEFPVIPIFYYVNHGLISPKLRGFYPWVRLPDGTRTSNLQPIHPLRDLWAEP